MHELLVELLKIDHEAKSHALIVLLLLAQSPTGICSLFAYISCAREAWLPSGRVPTLPKIVGLQSLLYCVVGQYFVLNTLVFIVATHECNNYVVTLCCSSTLQLLHSWMVTLMETNGISELYHWRLL